MCIMSQQGIIQWKIVLHTEITSAKAQSWNMLGLFEDRKTVSASAAAERTKGQVEGGQVGEGGKDRWCGGAF